MKTFSSICLIVSLFVLPCILNLEKLGCCLAIVVCTVVAAAVCAWLFPVKGEEMA